MTRRIRRISIGSAFVVMGTLYALLFAIIGLFVLILSAVLGLGNVISNQLGGNVPLLSGGGGIVTSIVIYVVGIVAYWLIGGIGGALTAIVYNIVAGITGGLRVEVV